MATLTKTKLRWRSSTQCVRVYCHMNRLASVCLEDVRYKANLVANSKPINGKLTDYVFIYLTVALFLSYSLCHLQFPESLLRVPGRRERHHGRDQGEAHRVSGLLFAPAPASRQTGGGFRGGVSVRRRQAGQIDWTAATSSPKYVCCADRRPPRRKWKKSGGRFFAAECIIRVIFPSVSELQLPNQGQKCNKPFSNFSITHPTWSDQLVVYFIGVLFF